MNLKQFVDSLPTDTFFSLLRACARRMDKESAKLVSNRTTQTPSQPYSSSGTVITPRLPPPTFSGDLPDVDLTKEEKDVAREGRGVPAVKLLRDRTGFGIITCKKIVERFMLKENIPTPWQKGRDSLSKMPDLPPT